MQEFVEINGYGNWRGVEAGDRESRVKLGRIREFVTKGRDGINDNE